MAAGGPPGPTLRGSSLIEVMLVLVVLAVLAALATPAVVPMIRNTQLETVGDEVASFIEVARRSAVATGRCFRIVQVGNDLRLDERDSPDCVNLALDGWVTGRQYYRPEKGVVLTLNGQAIGGVADPEALIFRPSGRLRGNANLDVTDDGVRVLITVNGIPDRARAVRVTPVGRICVVSHTLPAPATPSPLSCP